MNNFKKPGLYFGIASIAVVLISFQNCSKTSFTQVPEQSLKTEDMVQGIPSDEGLPPEVVMPSESVPDPAVSPAPTSSPVVATPEIPPYSSPTPVATAPGRGNNGGGNVKPPVVAAPGAPIVSQANAVECDLKRPRSKVIFSQTLGVGSNASATRVCMSENACLNLLNAYASARDCSLAAGPATSEASGQCTAVFPGSKGTCKKAQILSDAQVSDLIAAMSAPEAAK